jgi:hypothetical protein
LGETHEAERANLTEFGFHNAPVLEPFAPEETAARVLKGRIRGIYFRGEIYWFGKMVNGRRSSVSLETRDYAEAVERAGEILDRPELQPAQAFSAEELRFTFALRFRARDCAREPIAPWAV